MKICVVTVTYGDRFKFLKQVIETSFKEGINKVIVIDNASVENSRNKLRELEKQYKDKLRVKYLKENIGSAGGFKKGLEFAYNEPECEYILTLDDDNLIVKNSIKKLKNLMVYLERLNKNFILSFFRESRCDNVKVIHNGWIKGYAPNNFNGFNFLQAFKNKFFKSKMHDEKMLFPLQPIKVTAMGGSFFHKSIIEKIGYPNEAFFLYAEDHDWSYRFTKLGGHIFLCSELRLKDLDSTNLSSKGNYIGYFDKEFPEFKMYYQVRNHAYFSKNFIKNKIFFYGNMIVYLLLPLKKVFKVPINIFLRRYLLLLKAVNDGLNDKLGKTF